MDAAIRVAEVSPTRGASWLGEAFQLFRRAPLAWIGLCSGWLVVTFGLLLVPFLGGVIANLLQPIFFASFAIAAFKQAAGEPVIMGDLFSGFRRNVRALVLLGAVMLAAELLVVLIMIGIGLPMANAEASQTISEYVEALKGKSWILLIGFVLTAAVKCVFWFAPPLIAFHDMSFSEGTRWSAYAAISNLGAMIVYGVALVVLFMAAMLPWGLGLFVVIPLMAISTFVGYREVFEAGRAPVSSA